MGTGIPNKRQKLAKWNGWGYKDTDFTMDEKKDVYVTGDRYVLSGKCIPDFRPWFENFTGLDTRYASPAQSWPEMQQKIHKPVICKSFVDELKQANCFKYLSFDDEVRLMHSHGHCCQEIYQLRYGKFKRLVDVVIYPDSHDHVEKIVSIATKYPEQLTIIPYGGGTNVTQALLCPENEKRMIVSIDTQEMDRILSVDFESNTAVIEAGAIGTQEEVDRQQKIIYDITSKYGGLKAGAEAGSRGYLLTYVIAYLRDYGFNYYFMAESFETSVPWSNIVPMIKKVEERVKESAKKKGVPSVPWVSARVTQTYETGACVYFYYGFIFRGLSDPIKVFSEIESEARDEILLQGGSLSHHHGIGKLRREWMNEVVRDQGVDILKGLKQKIDPHNLFGNGNMGLTQADLSISANIE
ncbi:predicted protein [Naegleria gruberi]|uniref:Alkylglycerone-phosphate synthase n=1 Tax=Naegleria gruberi TaxID=5762 RepID=D2VLW2_NAEGR|nr:uncharacterized protein NAEGRDRAFT_50637 [Naegleria gruberi]EFC42211.1 predicted protein [Naegleria gruberi]|eukprot:XP_002674955.1 predicted protein [Naegleria gruberi strain NEG-M]